MSLPDLGVGRRVQEGWSRNSTLNQAKDQDTVKTLKLGFWSVSWESKLRGQTNRSHLITVMNIMFACYTSQSSCDIIAQLKVVPLQLLSESNFSVWVYVDTAFGLRLPHTFAQYRPVLKASCSTFGNFP